MFWPACHLIRGKPRHSESNGGVERSNRTVEDKLGLWMSENKSQHWSVGLPLVLFTGQNPRVGISSLPIDPELIKKLYTEVQVSALSDGQSTRTELKCRTSRGWFGLVMGIVLERGPDGHDGAVGIESSGMLETEVGGYT
jgi:hypothetical protein